MGASYPEGRSGNGDDSSGNDDVTERNDDPTRPADDGSARNPDFTGSNSNDTDPNDGFPPAVQATGRRSVLKAVGATVALPLFATAARASDGTGDEADDGSKGYHASVSRDHATVVVSTFEELANALDDAGAGDVVFVAGDAVIDVGSSELTIPAGVTLASDRGEDGSFGGHVTTASREQWPGVLTAEDEVRVTGLRISGPVNEYCEYEKPVTSGLVVDGTDCEVDNVEAWGFNHAAIRLDRSAHVHHSYVHNNPMDGLGYGVLCKGGDTSVIEHNRFDYNRHSVANGGSAGYVVRYNHFGSTAVSYQVGTHRPGGTSLEIHHNTFEPTEHLASDGDVKPHVVIRGTPSDGADVHHNWFFNPREPLDAPSMWTDEAITQIFVDRWQNVEFSDNVYGPRDPLADVGCPWTLADPLPWECPRTE